MKPAVTSGEKKHFENLDALRFFAFFGVFLFHSFHTDSEAMLTSDLYRNVKFAFSSGGMGVHFFFTLSGFLITYLLMQEEAKWKKISLMDFWMRRALRIWPLYFACVAFGFLAFPMIKQAMGAQPSETANIFYFLTFTSNFNNIFNGLPDASLLAVLWSIGVEEQFYVAWPILFIILRKFRIALLFLLILISMIFRYFFAFGDILVTEFHTLSVLPGLASGCILGIACFCNYPWLQRLRLLSRWKIMAIYGAGIILLLLKSIIFSRLKIAFAIENFIFSLFFAFIIWEQIYAKNSFIKTGKLRTITALGKISYGLYCLHFIGILCAIKVSSLLFGGETKFSVFIFNTVFSFFLTVALAQISYRLLEQPFLKLKKKYARG